MRACVCDLPSFCPITVTLDWSRLRKRRKFLTGMACRDGKATFPTWHEVKRRLFRMLWAGEVEAACGYLEGQEEERLKRRTRLEELVRHLRARERRSRAAPPALTLVHRAPATVPGRPTTRSSPRTESLAA